MSPDPFSGGYKTLRFAAKDKKTLRSCPSGLYNDLVKDMSKYVEFILTVLLVLFSGMNLLSAESVNAYFPGEELVYRVTALRFISAGTAVFRVESIDENGGGKSYRAAVQAASSPPFSFFFRVRNTMETIVDGVSLLPSSFVKDRREAAFRRRVELHFDRENGFASIKGQNNTVSITPSIQDYLSSFYYARGLDFNDGEPHIFTATGGRRNYDVQINILRREPLQKWGRTLETVVIQPAAADFESGGLIEDAPELLIWITDDERRIPLRMEAELKFGRVTMVLIDYTEGAREGAADGLF